MNSHFPPASQSLDFEISCPPMNQPINQCLRGSLCNHVHARQSRACSTCVLASLWVCGWVLGLWSPCPPSPKGNDKGQAPVKQVGLNCIIILFTNVLLLPCKWKWISNQMDGEMLQMPVLSFIVCMVYVDSKKKTLKMNPHLPPASQSPDFEISCHPMNQPINLCLCRSLCNHMHAVRACLQACGVCLGLVSPCPPPPKKRQRTGTY